MVPGLAPKSPRPMVHDPLDRQENEPQQPPSAAVLARCGHSDHNDKLMLSIMCANCVCLYAPRQLDYAHFNCCAHITSCCYSFTQTHYRSSACAFVSMMLSSSLHDKHHRHAQSVALDLSPLPSVNSVHQSQLKFWVMHALFCTQKCGT